MQVTTEAIHALSALMLTVTNDADAAGAPAALGCIQRHGQKLRAALQNARYHQIKQCRAAAAEALAVLETLAPTEAPKQASRERQEREAIQPLEGQRRKGPWLHEKVAAAPAHGRSGQADAGAAQLPQALPQTKRKVTTKAGRHALWELCACMGVVLHASDATGGRAAMSSPPPR